MEGVRSIFFIKFLWESLNSCIIYDVFILGRLEDDFVPF